MVAMDDWHGRRRCSRSSAGRRRSPALPQSRATTRCSTCSPAATRATRSPSCGRGWSGTASTGDAHRPARRAAARRHQRRHDPRPRPVRRVPGRRRRRGRRVGELDEEMVYESRVGDVFTLGSTSWRIEDITHDRVLVSPAPGQPGRLPFWKGDALGRPAELGRARRRVRPRGRRRSTPSRRRARARAAGLDAWAADNLLAYLDEQREATGHVPDDRTIVVERFRDELGDWRVVVHSPFGAQVHAPWALAIAARLRERYGVDVQAMHADDGIVLRLPDTDATTTARRRADARALLDPDEVEPLVTAEVGGSALFAARFRECAARALLLPRRDPDRRTPLWQQRQRSAQLLSVAREYGSFPIVLETMRECLQDVFDVPGLRRADARRRGARGARRRGRDHRAVAVRPLAAVRLRRRSSSTRATPRWPSGAPRRWRSTPRCSPSCSARPSCASCSTPTRSPQVEAELQRLHRRPARHATLEGVADLLRIARTADHRRGARARRDAAAGSHELEAARRAIRVRVAGEERWAADRGRRPAARRARASRCRSACPRRSSSRSPTRSATWSRATPAPTARSPPTTSPRRFGLGVAVVDGGAGAGSPRPAASSRASSGPAAPAPSGATPRCCGMLRRRSLAALRQEVEPVPPAALGRFLPAWQRRRAVALRGVDGVLRVVEQLARARGARVGAGALVLPARVADYTPALLDELTAAGEVVWAGPGALPGDDGWVVAAPGRRRAADCCPRRRRARRRRRCTQRVLDALAGGGALFFRGAVRPGRRGDRRRRRRRRARRALWDLVWAGRLTNDTLAPLRALARRGRAARTAPGRAPPRAAATAAPGRAADCPSRTGPPTVRRPLVAAARAASPTRPGAPHALAEALLDRHGVVTRGAVVAERVARRVRRRLPRARRVRGHRALPARLLRRGPGRRPVRRARRGRPAARRPPPTGASRAPAAGARRHRPGQPVRRGAALARPPAATVGRPGTGRAARPARSSCSSTASWCSTSSAAGARCCRSTDDAAAAAAGRRRPRAGRPRRRARPARGRARRRGGRSLDSPLGAALGRGRLPPDAARPAAARRERAPMPEGDVVWRTARRLDAALAGATLDRASDLRRPRARDRRPRRARRLRRRPRGKHLLTALDAGLTLHSAPAHGRRWHLFRAGDRWRRRARATRSASCWADETLDGGRLPRARRRAGPRRRRATLVGHLGPDLLGRRLRRRRGGPPARAPQPGPAVGEALLDQTVRRRHRQPVQVARRCSCPASTRGRRAARSPTSAGLLERGSAAHDARTVDRVAQVDDR